jgi:antitoxin FitA
MTDLLVRDIDPKVKRKIAERARAHGRSMSEEVKETLNEKFGGPAQEEITKMGTWLFNLVPPEYRGDDLVFEIRDYPTPPDLE